MSNFNNEFQEIINKVEVFTNKIEALTNKVETLTNKVERIEKNQNLINDKINQIYNSVIGIENDIYEEDFDFEINCPYCNEQFVADIESKTEIKCPECHNTIELDWNFGDESGCCSRHCSSCSSKCGESFLEEFGENINIIDDYNKEQSNDENDDD